MYDCWLYQGDTVVGHKSDNDSAQLVLWAKQEGRQGDSCEVYSTVTAADGRQEKVSLEINFTLDKEN